ncbi:MAG: hypothetical protein KF789_12385 [Bdellovibrionaceae bacterium]|nr:hypothetical protein [Pseudobdellovibrionaceae bacterium]
MKDAKKPEAPARPLVEGQDFEMENGLMVLTREYLLRRGFCCGNGCRNCPYEETEREETAED